MNKHVKIDFIGIGVQKSGTSWLFNNLRKLPDFSLLPIKELHYFDRHPKYYSSTVLFEESIFKRVQVPSWWIMFRFHFLRTLKRESFSNSIWKLKYLFEKGNDKRYLSFFENQKGFKGEVTPSYSILEKEDIQKMYCLAPDAKLILLLRNPIYRAWSQFLHERRKMKDYETKKINIEEAILFLNSRDRILRSDYERMLENYLSVYPKSQLIIGFFDAITNHPHDLMHSIVKFIGGNTNHISIFLDLELKFNVNKKIEIPDEVFDFLKSKYKEPIERLAMNYGGYFNVWLEEIYGYKTKNENLPTPTLLF